MAKVETNVKSKSSSSRQYSLGDSTLIYRESVPKYGNYISARVLGRTTQISENGKLSSSIPASSTTSSSGATEGEPLTSQLNGEAESVMNNFVTKTDATGNPHHCDDLKHSNSEPAPPIRPVNVVGPMSSSNLTGRPCKTSGGVATDTVSLDLDLPMLGQGAGVKLMSYSEWEYIQDRVVCLQKENDDYRAQLDRQHQVNTELKKLLVASLGEGVEGRLDKLAQERADLCVERDQYTKQMMNDCETIDKISIQADMWRSKFIASKMMGDELARTKALYSMKYQESQNALLGLLNERHELRAALLQSQTNMQQIQGAFDPLNSHPHCPNSPNILDLSSQILQLSQTVKFRLLPPTLSLQSALLPTAVSTDKLTRAESFAQEVISRRVGVAELNPPQSPSMPHRASPPLKFHRYHPDVKYDNITYNCCSRCHGDILVM